jgi:hypothetical protein
VFRVFQVFQVFHLFHGRRGQAQKKKRRLDLSKRRSIFFALHRSADKGGCDSHMYTFEPRFVFRKISAVSISRPAPKLTNQTVVSNDTVPLGFCSGGFSSTAGYVPGNEAQRLST